MKNQKIKINEKMNSIENWNEKETQSFYKTTKKTVFNNENLSSL